MFKTMKKRPKLAKKCPKLAKSAIKKCPKTEKELPDVITYGCLAHVFNLLGIDLTPTAVMKHVVEINKIFRNHHIPSSWLNNHHDAKRPTLPSETMWKGQLMCLESYIHKLTQQNLLHPVYTRLPW